MNGEVTNVTQTTGTTRTVTVPPTITTTIRKRTRDFFSLNR